MDISSKYLEAGELGRFLSRQVVVLRLARSEVIFSFYLSFKLF